MLSQQLSEMAVGVTQAIVDQVSTILYTMLLQVTSSLSISDVVVLSVRGKFRQVYSEDILVKRLNCFAAEVLKKTSVMLQWERCVSCFSLRLTDTLLLSQCPLMPPTEAPLTASVLDGENLNKEPNTVSDSAVVSPPPLLTPPAEAPLTVSEPDAENLKDKPTREPGSSVVSTLPPLTPPAEDPVASVLDGESLKKGPDRQRTRRCGFSSTGAFFNWIKKHSAAA
ncbi:uncharacterized protein LOC108885785 [Scomber scombrus]|uniref:Uncharacterized protein LOC108885785 n=1 Tax=Scomber scombrus TaxID=13677 RepID=A0AAV1PEK9_SCOSC